MGGELEGGNRRGEQEGMGEIGGGIGRGNRRGTGGGTGGVVIRNLSGGCCTDLKTLTPFIMIIISVL